MGPVGGATAGVDTQEWRDLTAERRRGSVVDLRMAWRVGTSTTEAWGAVTCWALAAIERRERAAITRLTFMQGILV